MVQSADLQGCARLGAAIRDGSLPTICIGIPTYNGAQHLPQLARSLNLAIDRAAQRGIRISKLYVADDSSTDGTPQLAAELLSFHSGLSISLNPGRRGESGNTNYLFRQASSDGFQWLLLLHQDDLVSAEWIERTVAELLSDPENLVVVAPRADASPETADRDVGWVGVRRHFRGTETLRRATREWIWCLSGSCIRVDSYIAAGGMDESMRYGADLDMMAKLILGEGDVLEIGHTLIAKRDHAQNQSALGAHRAYAIEGLLVVFHRYGRIRQRRERVLLLLGFLSMAIRNAFVHLWRKDLHEVGLNLTAMRRVLCSFSGALRK